MYRFPSPSVEHISDFRSIYFRISVFPLAKHAISASPLNGMPPLELSKKLMYGFHYDFIKSEYGDRAKLLLTDTDSFIYHCETEDIYDDFLLRKELFDFLGFPENHKCYDISNKKVIGKFKDETSGIPIVEFVGLRSKLYSYKLLNNKEHKRAKGINKEILKNNMHHSNYVNTLIQERDLYTRLCNIRSEKHQLFTIRSNKKCLSAFDDKRYLLDATRSLPFGHCSLDVLNEILNENSDSN